MPYVVEIECPPAAKDRLIAELFEAGTQGIAEEESKGRCRLRAYFADERREAAARFAYCGQLRFEEPADWVAIARECWRPQAVGERFYLAPSWSNQPTPAGRLRLEMPPGTASGTGLHPATQLMLEAMERCLRPGDRFLDLGTGSGILAAAALRLGAGAVFASDVDSDAIQAAAAYLQGSGVRLFVGSADGLRAEAIDVVGANIDAPTISREAEALAALLRPGGRLLAGGFTVTEASPVDAALRGAGLAAEAVLPAGEWRCLIAARTP